VNYDAVLFDFDGVLADTEPLHFEAWQKALGPAGVQLTWPLYVERCIGLADKEMVKMLGSLASPPKPIHELWPLYPLKQRLFQALAMASRVIQEPTLDAVKTLSGMRLAVVTSSARSEIEPILIRDGLMPLLSTAVFGDEVSRLKPDPEPYLTACQRLGVSQALVFEDSPSGIASARAAGCEVVEVSHALDLPDLIRRTLS
jgi:HAD superfamily hydrolase (TIGR01509 family)